MVLAALPEPCERVQAARKYGQVWRMAVSAGFVSRRRYEEHG